MPTVQELLSLDGRVAVVAGGAGLLGFQMATALAEAGAQVVIASRNLEKCEAKAAEKAALDALTPEQRRQVSDNTARFLFGNAEDIPSS